MKLLEIQASARMEGSISRALSKEFIQSWQSSHSRTQHQLRDVGTFPPAHPTEQWTKANYTPPSQQIPEMAEVLAESEQLIEELFWADRLLLGIPMYNFSVPSTFKAYIDNIVRVNRTFTFDATNLTFQGLVTHPKALIITPSAGHFTPESPLREMNFCETYLRTILGFIGIEEITVISVPNQFMSDEVRQKAIREAQENLMALASNW